MSVLRRGYVEVEPDVSGFDEKLREKFQKQDPGGKAGRQLGGQLNRALKRLDLEAVDVRADPKKALAAIAATEARLQALSRNASTIEIKVRAEQGLKEIGRFRKTLGDVGEDAAPEFALSFSQRLGPLLAKLPIGGPMSVGLAGAAASAAPLIGAAVAGGIIGGVGIGGVVGGLSLAAKDTRVKAATEILGDRLEARLNRAGGAFVRPALEGLRDIQRAADDIDLEGILGGSAKLVPSLTTGVASAVTDIGGALKDLIDNAGPPVAAISEGIAQIGRSAAEGLSSLADNGEDGAAALRTLFDITSSVVSSTFQLVNVLTELYGIGQKIHADALLQATLKLTTGELDKTGFSAQRTAEGLTQLDGTQIQTAVSAETLKKKQEQLKAVQDAVTVSQNALSSALDGLGGKTGFAARTSDALRTAMDYLYGATIRQSDANSSYEASWDDLSDSVKNNKSTLDVHTAAGRSNRDALAALLTKNNELYLANINAGVSIDSARKKHENRTTAIKEEARRLGLNRKETQRLIETYGDIPGKKTTDLVLDGVREVVRALQNLYIYQRALAEGRSIASIEQKLRTGSDSGPAKRNGGYATGGLFDGQLPGPPSKVDNLRGHGPDGRSFGLAGGEFIVNAGQTAKHRSVLEAINAGFDGFAAGGYLAPVDTSRRWPFTADLSDTYVMSRKQAASKVAPAIPAGGRTSDFIVAAAKALVPGIRVISKDRPGARTLSGNVSYHSRGRAVDFAPSEKLARLWNQNYKARTKELISPYQQYNLHNGQRHTYTGAVWNQHNFAGGNAHDHIAMDDGGFRMLQPGMNLIPNGTGKKELIGGPAAMASLGGGLHIHIHDSVIASERQAVDLVAKAYKIAVQERKIAVPSKGRS